MRIVRRVREAKAASETILSLAARAAREMRTAVERAHGQVAADASSSVARRRRQSRDAMNAIGLSAVREVHRQHATPCQFAQSERAAEAATGLTTFRNCPLPKRLRLGLGAHFRHRPRLCPTPM
jgi:hypothetical protein